MIFCCMKYGSRVIALLVVIVVILMLLVVLFVNGVISFNWSAIDVENTQENKGAVEEELEVDKESSIVEVILPSNEKISVNEEYIDIFNDNKKIIINKENVSSELTLSEFLKQELDKWPADFYTGKKISVSSTLFDFDDDGINEIMFSFCEEYILLHYYDGEVYGYALGGYRTNGSWRVNGTSVGSGGAYIGCILKYSFNGSELVSDIIAEINRVDGDISVENEEASYYLTFKLNGEFVTETEYKNFIEEQKSVALIDYVYYSQIE